jgi:hypothetical protein
MAKWAKGHKKCPCLLHESFLLCVLWLTMSDRSAGVSEQKLYVNKTLVSIPNAAADLSDVERGVTTYNNAKSGVRERSR